jgi:hypothetical protein
LHGILNVLLAHTDLVASALNLLQKKVELLGRRTLPSSVGNCIEVRYYDSVSRLETPGFFSILRFVKSESLVELIDIGAKLLDHLNKVDVFDHDVQVVFLVNLTFLLESLLQSTDTVVKELFLVFVLLLNISINGHSLHGLVLHVLEKRVSNGTLQLIKIVNVLNNPVDRSFKPLNVTVVFTDEHAVSLVDLMQFLLLILELINDKTKVSVDFIVPFERAIHFICIDSQVHNFLLARSNITFEFLDLKVEDVLEFV